MPKHDTLTQSLIAADSLAKKMKGGFLSSSAIKSVAPLLQAPPAEVAVPLPLAHALGSFASGKTSPLKPGKSTAAEKGVQLMEDAEKGIVLAESLPFIFPVAVSTPAMRPPSTIKLFTGVLVNNSTPFF